MYNIILYNIGGGYSIRSPDFILVSLKLLLGSLYDIEKKLWDKNFIIIKPNMDTVSYFNDNFIHVFLDLIISGNQVFRTVTKCFKLMVVYNVGVFSLTKQITCNLFRSILKGQHFGEMSSQITPCTHLFKHFAGLSFKRYVHWAMVHDPAIEHISNMWHQQPLDVYLLPWSL